LPLRVGLDLVPHADARVHRLGYVAIDAGRDTAENATGAYASCAAMWISGNHQIRLCGNGACEHRIIVCCDDDD